MAIIKFGVIVTDMRGKLGASIFSKNGTGNYVKAWAQPPNPKTDRQVTQRITLANNNWAWAALSPANKALWNTYAALPAQQLTNSMGVTYYISGYLWFIKINNQLLTLGHTARTTPPLAVRPTAPTIVSANMDKIPVEIATITYGALDYLGGLELVLYAAQMDTTGSTAQGTSPKLVSVSQNPGFPPYNFYPTYIIVYGTFLQFASVNLLLYRQDNQGQRSPAATLLTTIT